MAYVINKEVCVGCGACESTCPASAISATDDNKYVIGDACVDCGACESACPVSAISQK
ncbi:MAG: 4Fe-4S binding protein [Endomicrobiaceae bacterium]|jgi:NAD-dependent dihydropyrimidine dehydrogenase PreA subunit|nr:4Fe-4S binding protein [Endomicrobiaceae bacterium]MDD3729557.1 4Fe-4S binding protein [Endomicrobiaceae bacterium]MDD4165506.1 4Fe-4S binding protein [Endomicrobiaceae bacterium]